MAREFDGPLNADDLVWLRARHSEAYVARMVDLHGTKAKAEGKSEATAAKQAEEAEKARLQAEQEAADALEAQRAAEAEAEVERAQAAAEEASQPPAADGEEDLIGDTTPTQFDVLGSTEAEVKAWAEKADDDAKAAALATEQGREDRDPRKGVVGLLS